MIALACVVKAVEVGRRPGGNEQRQDDAGQSWVQAAGEHARPQGPADDDVGRQRVDVRPVEQRQRADQRNGRRQIDEAELARIECGDRKDCAEIVDDRRRGEEDAQFDRDSRSQHDDQRHREGGVGRHRHAPAMRPGSGRNDQKIERRRRDRAADCASDRQRGRAPPCEVADREFALDLEAHDQKEDGEQSVVDPML